MTIEIYPAKWFQEYEFDCPCCGNNGMNLVLIGILDTVRSAYGRPINPTSGWRCTAHNMVVGGKPTSSHLKGMAVDISVISSRQKFWLVKLFMECGITRIGVGDTFIHVDIDPDKSQNVMWTY